MVVCAFVVTLGWLLAFKPVGAVDAATVDRPLAPERSALAFGFLGAYFFALQLIGRRYARGDLKPKAYSYITVRILAVAVLSWVLNVVLDETRASTLVIAFLIGILPDEFFTLIKEWFRGHSLARIVPESERHPLTKLEGIDLYDRARLEQEGIVNVESFAHHDLIQLVLGTQIPVPQLVDWMDQASLYLHVVGAPSTGQPPVTPIARLREYGIRTTTNLLSCWDEACKRKEVEKFSKLLGGAGEPYHLTVIRDSLLNDEWLKRVQDWRNDAEPDTRDLDAFPKGFEAKLRWATELEDKGRYKLAIQTLGEAIEIHDDAGARLRLARLLARVPVLSLRSPLHSRHHARRAFELGRDDVDVMEGLIDIHVEHGELDVALQACERAIALLGLPRNDTPADARLKVLKKTKKPLEKWRSQQPGGGTATVAESEPDSFDEARADRAAVGDAAADATPPRQA